VKKDNKILVYFKQKPLTSSELADQSGLSQRQVQRSLTGLVNQGWLLREGAGRSTVYKVNPKNNLYKIIDPKVDLSDIRLSLDPIKFNFAVLEWLKDFRFSQSEKDLLKSLTQTHQNKLSAKSKTLTKKEFERLVVEFSWKSSQIEGNTYTLLETEKLLEWNQPSKSHTSLESQMIINHKLAFDFIFKNPDYFKTLNSKKILEIHKILAKDLRIPDGLRSSGVGITGSLFRPLDNQFEIQEALEKLCKLTNSFSDIFIKSLVLAIMIPYIQPFEDGNKRTSRLLTNATLFAYGLPLISYRSTSTDEYLEAMLGFYEYNSIVLFKEMFISQLKYFVDNYF
jgi:Fic family protein